MTTTTSTPHLWAGGAPGAPGPNGALAGSGLALAGWICGLAGILVSAVYVALLLAGILALGSLGYLTPP